MAYWKGLEARLSKNSGTLNLQIVAAQDDASLLYSELVEISTGTNYYIELYLKRSTVGGSNGELVWYINGVEQTSITSISNYELYQYIDKIKLGNVERSSANAVANIDYDDSTTDPGATPEDPIPPEPVEITPPIIHLVFDITVPSVISAAYISPDPAELELSKTEPSVIEAVYCSSDPVDLSFENSVSVWAPQEFYPGAVDCVLQQEILTPAQVQESVYVRPDPVEVVFEGELDFCTNAFVRFYFFDRGNEWSWFSPPPPKSTGWWDEPEHHLNTRLTGRLASDTAYWYWTGTLNTLFQANRSSAYRLHEIHVHSLSGVEIWNTVTSVEMGAVELIHNGFSYILRPSWFPTGVGELDYHGTTLDIDHNTLISPEDPIEIRWHFSASLGNDANAEVLVYFDELFIFAWIPPGFTYPPDFSEIANVDLALEGSVQTVVEARYLWPGLQYDAEADVALEAPVLLPSQVRECVYLYPQWGDLAWSSIDPELYLGDTNLRIFLRTGLYLAVEIGVGTNPPPLPTGMNDTRIWRTHTNNTPIRTHTNDKISERGKV